MNLLWMLEDAPVTPTSAVDMIFDAVTFVCWGLIAILAVVVIVKGITTAIGIVKAADEPQVRQEKLNSFKYIAIAIGIVIVIMTALTLMLPTIKGWVTNNLPDSSLGGGESRFLF